MSKKFLGTEWASEMGMKLEAEFSKKGRVSSRIVQLMDNCPDGDQKWTYFEVAKGKFVKFEVGAGDAPEYDFAFNADYRIFAGMLDGSVSGEKAFADGSMKLLGGSQFAAMKLLGTFNRFQECAGTIDAEY